VSKHPVKRAERALRKVEPDAVEVIGPAGNANAFFSFRYSYTEISAVGDKAHLKSRHARLENGKLTSETFDGDFDRSVHEQVLREAQNLFLGQTALLMKALTWMLPFPRSQRRDGE
jgi:hypothetical protein